MVTKEAIKPYRDLLDTIGKNFDENVKAAVEGQSSFLLSRCWLTQYTQIQIKNEAVPLANASQSSSIEVVSLISLGLVRPSIFSLRNHYEFFLDYLFYRDHPIEWKAAASGEDWVKAPSELKKYFRNYFKEYERRWKALLEVKTRKDDDCYGVLSAFVHGGPLHMLPATSSPATMSLPNKLVAQVPNLIKDVAEFLSDVSVCCHQANWSALPSPVQDNLMTRFSGESPQKELSL